MNHIGLDQSLCIKPRILSGFALDGKKTALCCCCCLGWEGRRSPMKEAPLLVRNVMECNLYIYIFF